MSVSINSLRLFVAELGARPGMWLGSSVSLCSFAATIVGYEAALRDAGVVPLAPFPISHLFSEWLSAQWKVSPVVSWVAHIEDRFGNDMDAITEAAKLIEQWFRVSDAKA